MRVKVKLTEPICRTVGTRDTTVDLAVDRATMADILNQLAGRYPRFGEEIFSKTGTGEFYYSLFLNDDVVSLVDREKTYVEDGDEVFVLIPVAGGSSDRS